MRQRKTSSRHDFFVNSFGRTTQGGYLVLFLPLEFSVKSILIMREVQKLPIFAVVDVLNVDFL